MDESRIRLERKQGFTVLQNSLLRDRRLSLKTKGLFAVIASLPPDWEYSISGLAKFVGVGRDAIRTALKELEDAAYLERQQAHGERGHFSGCVYVIHDASEQPEECASPLSGFPTTVNPTTVEPTSVNPTQQSKDLTKERSSKPPKAPQGGRGAREPKEKPDWKPERFARFWDYYRTNVRPESKQAAIRAWDKLKPNDDLIADMGRALSRQVKSRMWSEGVGRPYASTWLNNRRWDEEVAEDGAPPDSSGGWAPDPEVL